MEISDSFQIHLHPELPRRRFHLLSGTVIEPTIPGSGDDEHSPPQTRDTRFEKFKALSGQIGLEDS
jgi:hypothetical protein